MVRPRFRLFGCLAAMLVTGPARSSGTSPPTLAEIVGETGFMGPRPSSFAFSPDGTLLTYLLAPELEGPADLFVMDVATGERRVLLAASALGSGTPSPEELASLERRRVKHGGITSHRWLDDGSGILVPHAGDVFLVRLDGARPPGGSLERVTSTDGPELTPAASADGSRILVSWRRDLWLLSRDPSDCSFRETRLTFDGTDDCTNGEAEFVAAEELGRHEGLYISRDGRRAAYLQANLARVPRFRIGDPIADRGGVEEQAYPRAGDPNAALRLGMVDLDAATPETLWVRFPAGSAGDGADFYVGGVRFAPDGRLLVTALTRDQRRRDLVLVESSGEARVVLSLSDDRWLDPSNDVAWIGEGLAGPRPRVTGLVCIAPWEDEMRPVRVDFDRPGAMTPLTAGPGSVQALHGIDAAGDWLFVTASLESPRERHLHRIPLGGGAPERLTFGRGHHAVTLAPDASRFVDAASTVDRPPTWTVVPLSPGAPPLAVADPSTPRLHDLPPVDIRFIEVPGEDGRPLLARLMLPATLRAGERRPVLVTCYGGPGSQTVLDAWGGERDIFERYLVGRGWITFRVDGRGTGGRGLAFAREVFRDLGSREAADQAAAARWLAGRPFVDPDRMALTGWSYGGYLTLMTLLRHPGVFRAGVAGAPVVDWRDYDTCYTERYMGLPAENAEGYARSSCLTHAPALADALLVIHGLADDNVHVQGTARLVEALVAAERPFETALVPGQRHGFKKPARLHALRLMESFLDREVREAGPRARHRR